jgi:CheY-like chemotaxis protein
MRILVVDDNPDIIEEISHTLRRRGHEVISATGVKDALVALATQAPVACVITDMRLPEGSALKFLMSGEANTDEINEACREGLEAIFWKPVSLRMVVEAVHERDKAEMARELMAAH